MPTKWRSYRDHRSCDFTSPYISNNRLISALRSSGLQSVVRSPATARTAATPTADVSTSGPNVAHTTTTLNRTVAVSVVACYGYCACAKLSLWCPTAFCRRLNVECAAADADESVRLRRYARETSKDRRDGLPECR